MKPYATRRGRTINLHPSGATFQIPQDWMDWHNQFDHNIYLSRNDLKEAESAIGESDRTFSAIVNSVLSFDQCAVHVGSNEWSSTYVRGAGGGLQMRVYTGQVNVPEVWRRVETTGLKKAAEDYARRKGSTPSVASIQQNGWQGKKLSYELFFVDYFITDNIEFLSRQRGNQSIVIVFMYNPNDSRSERDIKRILSSFVWKS